MNTKEIIESGKLELYVCGALSEREMREISLLADLNTDLNEEIARIENDLVHYAESFEKSPNQAALDKVLKNIKAGNKTFQVDFKRNKFNWVYTISLVLILLLGFSTAIFWKKTQNLNLQVQSLLPLNDTIKTLKEGLDLSQAKVEFLNRNTTRKYKFIGIDGKDSIDNFVLVYWCQTSKEICISPGNLPVPESGMAYQLWGMVAKKPFSLGVLDMTEIQKMGHISDSEAFFITLENARGASQPNMNAVQVFHKL